MFNPELFRPTPEQVAREEQLPVRYSHSFSFAMAPEELAALPPDAEVISEYGDRMTMQEFFAQVIRPAKFTFTDSVGEEFS